jgi:hypothetical protein
MSQLPACQQRAGGPSVYLKAAVTEHPKRLFNYSKYRREKLLSWGRKILPQPVMNCIYNTSLKVKWLRGKR